MSATSIVAGAFDRRAWPMGGLLDYWAAPDGWPLRRYRLGTGERGRMLLLGGRGDMIEKYLEVIAHWAGQGWAVTSFDWRGQGGSGRLLADPMTGHVEDFSQWIDDLSALAADWRGSGAEPGRGPSVMIGHSMGGHLLLRALAERGAEQVAERAVAPDAAILVAPMLGLNSGLLPAGWARTLARLMCGIGRGERQAWTQKESSRRLRRMRQKRLTHDPERYADELWWREHNRAIALGPPSWNWVKAAFASVAALETEGVLERIATPVLVLGTSADQLVSPAAIRRLTARIPGARLHIYGREAAHELLRELDGVRLDALARIDAFLDSVAP